MYGIAPNNASSSQWFDTIFKADVQAQTVVQRWHEPGVYVTEADFVPLSAKDVAEDSGLLLSVLFNSTSVSSSLAVFDARDLNLIQLFPLGGQVLPFHAHGIVCQPNVGCFSNP